MRAAAEEFKWNLNYGGIALMWRGGCIIRSTFLGKIKEAYDNNPKLCNLLLDPYFKEKIESVSAPFRLFLYQSLISTFNRFNLLGEPSLPPLS